MNTHGQQIEIGEKLEQRSPCSVLASTEIEILHITGLNLMKLAMKADQEFLALTPTVKSFSFKVFLVFNLR